MIRLCAPVLALLLALAMPALAADVVYPAGSRVGLVPPPDLTLSKNFFGFEDRGRQVAIVIAALPAEAYDQLETSATAETLKKQGVTLETREDFPHALGKALLVVGRQQVEDLSLRKWILALSTQEITVLVTVQVPDAAQGAYPEAAIRAALTSIAIRPSVPVTEQLSLLPFHLGELAGFTVGGVMPGRAIMLTDGKPAGATGVDTHMVVAIAPGAPAQASERDDFARNVFASIPNLKDVRITSSEPLRLGGFQAHQIMARGKDHASGTEVTIVQWIRFGGGAYLHLIGVAPTTAWLPAFGRFRRVRDGIELR